MQFSAKHLDKKDKFGKSDPYFKITFKSKVVFKSDVKKITLSPVWQDFEISAEDFCGGVVDAAVTVDVYDWDQIGAHDLIGSTKMALREIMEGREEWSLINPKKIPGGKKHKKGYENSGLFTLAW